MAKKNILVKDLLNYFPEESEDLVITFYAYGVYYANTAIDDIYTIKELKGRLRNDCLRAKVTRLQINDSGNTKAYLKVYAEMVL